MQAAPLTGDGLARIITPIPGPQSRALSARLARVESRNITRIDDHGPIFWTEAAGANVRDADGNVYVDLTAGFGVATAGHGNARVAAAIAEQARRLPHALGDVHPADVKVMLLERLARVAPGDLSVSILANSGAEAVEAALKTARLRTGRPGILAFRGGYHGLTYGALATTWRAEFRAPFADQVFAGVHFAPFPAEPDGDEAERAALEAVDAALDDAHSSGAPIGAVLVEPIQGRAGLVVPTPNFLRALRARCDGERRVLICDEVYTGCGRTGRWFACEHDGIVPDIMTVGKALTGALPVAAAIGSPAVMEAWPPSSGEAIHTSTFLGNPIGCAAAIAQLDDIESRDLIGRSIRLGDLIRSRALEWQRRFPCVTGVRGRGLLQAVQVFRDTAFATVREAQRKGVLLLSEGEHGNVLAITPPATITEAQLHFALDVLEACLHG